MSAEMIRPDPRRLGLRRTSSAYGGKERFAVDHMTAWNVRHRGTITHDLGLDHLVLTEGEEFDRVEFRVGGFTIEELPGGVR